MDNDELHVPADLEKVPVVLLDAYLVVNVTLPEGLRVIDAFLTTMSESQEQTIHRVRIGPNAAAQLVHDLQAGLLRVQGTPPPVH